MSTGLWSAINEAEEKDFQEGEEWAKKLSIEFPKAMEQFNNWRSMNDKGTWLKSHYFTAFLRAYGFDIMVTSKNEHTVYFHCMGVRTQLFKHIDRPMFDAIMVAFSTIHHAHARCITIIELNRKEKVSDIKFRCK